MSCTLAERNPEGTTMNTMASDNRNISNTLGDTTSTDEEDSNLWLDTFSNRRISTVNTNNNNIMRHDILPPLMRYPATSDLNADPEFLRRPSPVGQGQRSKQPDHPEADDDKKPAARRSSPGVENDETDRSVDRSATNQAYQSPVLQHDYDSAERDNVPLADDRMRDDQGYLTNTMSILEENYEADFSSQLLEYEMPYQATPVQHPGASPLSYHFPPPYGPMDHTRTPYTPYPPLPVPQRSTPPYPPPPQFHQRSPHSLPTMPAGMHSSPVSFRFHDGRPLSHPPPMPGTNTNDSTFYPSDFSQRDRSRRMTRSLTSGQRRHTEPFIPFRRSGGPGMEYTNTGATDDRARLPTPPPATARGMIPESSSRFTSFRSLPMAAKPTRQLKPSDEELAAAPNKRARDALFTWYERLNELYDYREHHGDCNVPQQYPENRRLGIWVNKQRMEKKAWDSRNLPDTISTSLTVQKLEQLARVGFVWAKPKGEQSWYEKYHELLEYIKTNKHCNVPTKYAPNPALGRWVSTQRSQYKDFIKGRPTKITQERIDKLNRLNFTWDMVAKAEDDDEPRPKSPSTSSQSSDKSSKPQSPREV